VIERRHERAVASVLLAGILLGTAGTAVALGPDGTTPLGVGAARVLLGGLVLLAVLVARGSSLASPLRVLRTTPGLGASACCATYQVCFFAAVEQTGVAVGTLVTIGSAPIAAGVLAWALNGSPVSRSWLVATGLCLAGLTFLAVQGLDDGSPLGVSLALVAGACAGTYNVLAKRLFDTGAEALLLPLLATQPLGWLATGEGIALVLYLGLATMAGANLLMTYGLRRLTPGPVTTLLLADPATAALLGVVVLHEPLSATMAVGLAFLTAGLLLQGARAARPVVPRPAVAR
jgi:DME family drug/metabolite transporter